MSPLRRVNAVAAESSLHKYCETPLRSIFLWSDLGINWVILAYKATREADIIKSGDRYIVLTLRGADFRATCRYFVVEKLNHIFDWEFRLIFLV